MDLNITDMRGDMSPLVEYPDTFNKYDGNDVIDIGDNNGNVFAYG